MQNIEGLNVPSRDRVCLPLHLPKTQSITIMINTRLELHPVDPIRPRHFIVAKKNNKHSIVEDYLM